jgi:hypothetical protein
MDYLPALVKAYVSMKSPAKIRREISGDIAKRFDIQLKSY